MVILANVEHLAAAYLILGSRMLLMPPSLTLILRQRFDNVCGDVLLTFLACTHCVARPHMMSPTRFTSATKTSWSILQVLLQVGAHSH